MAPEALVTPDSSFDLQRDVQRKLGRCLLRLQQYEILLKALVADADISGPPAELQAVRDAQVASAQKKTLGGLVSMLTERHLVLSDAGYSTEDSPQDASGFWYEFRTRLELDASQHHATIVALKELVNLRNELVHHFLPRFNIWEHRGCTDANAYLDASYETIDGHYLTLRGWIQAMQEARSYMASFMQTAAYNDWMVNGIAPDGSVSWPISGAVRSLRDAESRFKVDGWTLLNRATSWIHGEYPDQNPQRYGCGSWRHVIHESRHFEIRRIENKGTGRGEIWYRSRKEETNMDRKKSP